ncbi:ATPase, AAA family [Desulfamplus magnetovallimortis]|uniref:Uncharacterized AAA domain-containing protein ycf46 n=1 Tax=Desulfamplus magnetovallimortis TaxID=1246637 RepID=A0A1W1HEW8_9BACT|nr:AAA family ATPase [Desulfamplus magnetovallimortis]SLM30925.1 ATPase, AAA family [Desulfamplus magnetovallimortis]
MIKDYLKAGYPMLTLLTQEPSRAESIVICEGWTFYSWDCNQGIRKAGTYKIIEDIRDPVQAIEWLNMQQDSVLIAHNLHLFLEARIPDIIQAIQSGTLRWKSSGSSLVMISPIIPILPELDKFNTVIELPLPDTEALFELQKDLCSSLNIKPNRKAARIAKGLTEFEAETAYALSLIKKGYCSTRIISEQKSQMIRKSGLMEFWEPADIRSVGGLNNLKQFIAKRATAYESGNEHLPPLRGILLAGIPGTGKSLSCKATASILGWPLIKLDIGSLKGSLVGESERKMREATQVLEAFGEVIVWIDEVEKAFSGTKSSGETDGGSTANMFGYFLTWLQESKGNCVVMATANDITKLPPEFLRAGRFDATFFVDLPSTLERVEIIKIMNQKYNSNISTTLAPKLNGFSGAEIEQLAKDSLYDGVDAALEAIVPLSRTMKDEISNLQKWAQNRARLANNTPDIEPQEQRKIHVVPAA